MIISDRSVMQSSVEPGRGRCYSGINARFRSYLFKDDDLISAAAPAVAKAVRAIMLANGVNFIFVMMANQCMFAIDDSVSEEEAQSI
jgi:hypothetical protein